MIYFIDFENVHLNGLIGLESLNSKDTVVILFPYSLLSSVRKFLAECETDATIQLHCVSVGYKDALDVKLIVKAMLMYKAGNSKIAFISNDRIFAGIKDALKEFNYLGAITIAVGSACNNLFRYYCFKYGNLYVYERVENVFVEDGHDFSAELKPTFTLVETTELAPERNIKIHGIHTEEDKLAVLALLDAIEEPQCGKELLGIVNRESKPLAESKPANSTVQTTSPVVTTKKVYGVKERVRSDKEWNDFTYDFCYNFLYSVRTSCKLYSNKMQAAILERIRKTPVSKRSADTLLKITPGFMGCKETLMRELYDAYTKVGAPNAR